MNRRELSVLHYIRGQMQRYAERNFSHLLADPIIIGDIERFTTIDLNSVVIFEIDKNNILDDTVIITGTDQNELRILDKIPVKTYYKP